MAKELNGNNRQAGASAAHEGVSRRTFLSGLGAAAALTAGAGLMGCSSAGGSNNGSAQGNSGAGESSSAAAGWRTPPAPLEEQAITETLEADIVIVGTGASGALALTTALDAGASVIALQKEATSVSHGLYNGGYDTILQRAAGITIDLSEWKTLWLQNTGNWGSIPHLNQWVKYSNMIVNKLFVLSIEHENDPDCPLGPMKVYGIDPVVTDDWLRRAPNVHVLSDPFAEGQEKGVEYLETFGVMDIAEWLTQQAIQRGAEVRYNTPAVQLIRGGVANGTTGRVEGVLAENGDGTYLRCLAKKGVILCAGGYSNNEELKKEFLPHLANLRSGYSTTGNVGDAHKMGTWVGAQMRRIPHTSNIHYDPTFMVPNFPGTGYPWLRVNLNGERYSNEDVSYEVMYAQDANQPECSHYQIFDSNYPTDVQKLGDALFRNVQPFIESVPGGIESGVVYSGETIGELAEALGVPAESLEKTVQRYNELANSGYDEDYGKQKRCLLPIEKAPFLAIKRCATILDSQSGFVTNTDFQVLDTNNELIEGLYAAGNCQSPFFGGFQQPMNMGSMGTGRAFTTGHVAVLRACGIEDAIWPTTDELIAKQPEYYEIAKQLQSV